MRLMVKQNKILRKRKKRKRKRRRERRKGKSRKGRGGGGISHIQSIKWDRRESNKHI